MDCSIILLTILLVEAYPPRVLPFRSVCLSSLLFRLFFRSTRFHLFQGKSGFFRTVLYSKGKKLPLSGIECSLFSTTSPGFHYSIEIESASKGTNCMLYGAPSFACCINMHLLHLQCSDSGVIHTPDPAPSVPVVLLLFWPWSLFHYGWPRERRKGQTEHVPVALKWHTKCYLT